MNRRYRLTRPADFERVRRLGKSFAHPLLVLIALPNDLGQPRVGVAAGGSLGGAAQRNRAKRLLRAAVHPLLGELGGHDILLMARRPLLEASSDQAQAALRPLLKKAQALSKIT